MLSQINSVSDNDDVRYICDLSSLVNLTSDSE